MIYYVIHQVPKTEVETGQVVVMKKDQEEVVETVQEVSVEKDQVCIHSF